MRQAPDEAHGVGEGDGAGVRQLGLADGGVQGREQRVLDQHPGAGHPVEDARLAGVGVPGDGDGGDGSATTLGPFGVPGGAHVGDLALELGHPGADPAPVQLDLGLTRAAGADPGTTGHPTTGLARHRLAPAAQAGQQVLQLSQLDLRLALPGLGVLGEDVEDQGGPVDHLDLDDVLEATALRRAQLAVADDGVGAGLGDHVAELGGLAGTQERRRVRLLARLQQGVEHLRPSGLGEGGELRQRHLGLVRVSRGRQAGQHHALQAELAVLDLGDVCELGRQAGDPAQGLAVGKVVLVPVVPDVRACRRAPGVGGAVVGAGCAVGCCHRRPRIARTGRVLDAVSPCAQQAPRQ